MKKLLLLTIFSLASIVCSAQTDKETYALPIVEGEVAFSKIVQVDGKTADQLYASAKMAIAEMFKSAKDVIQLDDKENKLLIVKGLRMQADKGGDCSFMLRISAREGRYKVEMANFVGTRYSAYIGSTRMPEVIIQAKDIADDEKCFNGKGELRKTGFGLWRKFLVETKDFIFNNLEERINKSLALTSGSSDDEW